MGCFHQTCALTNLPIRGGETVYSLILQQTPPGMVSECYPNYAWTLTPFVFEGEYDDYGRNETH